MLTSSEVTFVAAGIGAAGTVIGSVIARSKPRDERRTVVPQRSSEANRPHDHQRAQLYRDMLRAIGRIDGEVGGIASDPRTTGEAFKRFYAELWQSDLKSIAPSTVVIEA